jgi:hypothetical protein
MTDPDALQIDHINGGGAIESRKIGSRGVRTKILNGETKEYQILCANCNTIKRTKNGEVGFNRKARHNFIALIRSNQTPKDPCNT